MFCLSMYSCKSSYMYMYLSHCQQCERARADTTLFTVRVLINRKVISIPHGHTYQLT